ncbi:MAG: hypothetical protein CL398_03250 [Acidiferrobacteraceae bacterium]|nr:hypothetical protein [Acidiferrobacteraceae bacterium]|tara:strand:- start:141 stop:707 length:567 start_codon:yes stop_codon:yes gene_type:complete
MAVELANHVHEMTNAELNSVAKLRFTDEATQVALAKHPYLLCRKYLAHNPNLCEEARDILLAGKANSVKANLMVEGHLNHAPEKISELYFSMKRRGFNWWNVSAFIRGYYWSDKKEAPNTPVEVLEDIYEGVASPENKSYGKERTLADVVRHPNSPIEMAIRASTSETEQVKQAGFARLIEIEKAKEK